jgi:hypothetical protein
MADTFDWYFLTKALYIRRPTAEGVVQHRLQEDISLLFSLKAMGALFFESVRICENLCPKFRILAHLWLIRISNF